MISLLIITGKGVHAWIIIKHTQTGLMLNAVYHTQIYSTIAGGWHGIAQIPDGLRCCERLFPVDDIALVEQIPALSLSYLHVHITFICAENQGQTKITDTWFLVGCVTAYFSCSEMSDQTKSISTRSLAMSPRALHSCLPQSLLFLASARCASCKETVHNEKYGFADLR